jgi:hypothetical protein
MESKWLAQKSVDRWGGSVVTKPALDIESEYPDKTFEALLVFRNEL